MSNNLFQHRIMKESTLDIDLVNLITNYSNMLCPLTLKKFKDFVANLIQMKVIQPDKTSDEWIESFLTKYPHVNLVIPESVG